MKSHTMCGISAKEKKERKIVSESGFTLQVTATQCKLPSLKESNQVQFPSFLLTFRFPTSFEGNSSETIESVKSECLCKRSL